ncbi:hypothetical protein C3007_08655 [Avibacterium gallinarum]|nr:hypothetical protein C3007_08655 [Avibacterium gallinarum]
MLLRNKNLVGILSDFLALVENAIWFCDLDRKNYYGFKSAVVFGDFFRICVNFLLKSRLSI